MVNMGQEAETYYEKERVYVRGISSHLYGGLRAELERLRKMPRVIKVRQLPWRRAHGEGPQNWEKDVVRPGMGYGQSLEIHLVEIAPGGRSQKHYHMNSAAFYILQGRGYDVHNGVRYDWEAGDLVIVPPATIHQHFNLDAQRPVRAIVFKSKPLYIFLGLVFQKNLEKSPAEPVPADYKGPVD